MPHEKGPLPKKIKEQREKIRKGEDERSERDKIREGIRQAGSGLPTPHREQYIAEPLTNTSANYLGEKYSVQMAISDEAAVVGGFASHLTAEILRDAVAKLRQLPVSHEVRAEDVRITELGRDHARRTQQFEVVWTPSGILNTSSEESRTWETMQRDHLSQRWNLPKE